MRLTTNIKKPQTAKRTTDGIGKHETVISYIFTYMSREQNKRIVIDSTALF